MSVITHRNISKLVQFLSDFGAPLSFSQLGVLMNIDSVIDEVSSLVSRLPEDLHLEERTNIREQVSFRDPCMPTEFYDAGLCEELSDLFFDIVSNDICDVIEDFRSGAWFEYVDLDNKTKSLIKKYLYDIVGTSSYGVVNYYDVIFRLPGLAELIPSAYDSDGIWRALEKIVDGSVDGIADYLEDLISVLLYIEEQFAQVTIDEYLRGGINVRELASSLRRQFWFLEDLQPCDYETVQECFEDVADIIRYELENEVLEPLLVLKRELPEAVQEYENIIRAHSIACKIFEKEMQEISESFEDIEYWRDYFEVNEHYDILARLFPEEYKEYAEQEEVAV